MPHGGWCPRGRLAEDGPIPARYELRETESSSYPVRTRWNVRDSDGTLLVTRGAPTGGSAFTAKVARELDKPLLHIDLDANTATEAVALAQAWIDATRVQTLNVAGPRASGCPGIGADVSALVNALLR